MEPSGFMDGQTSASPKGATSKNEKQKQDDETRYFSLYDVSDEEVHFSLEMIDAKTNAANNFVKHQQYPGFSQLGSLEQPISASYFADVNLNYNHLLPEPRLINAGAAETIKSSRLLNSIGSKLRRGSNYLVAPKLVGQYLLGITIQSWSEFFNTSQMMTKAPTTTQQLTRRLLTNLSYFQGNYMCISLVLVIYCILTSPLLLLAIFAYLVALYMVTARSATGRYMRILNYRPNLQQQYSFITLISIPLLWVAGAPSAVFWVIGASFVVVGLHASMYNLQQQLASSSASEQQFNEQQQVVYSSLSGNNNSVQYYNHYPLQLHHYLSVPTTRITTTQQQEQQQRTVKETNSYYTNIISHWISGTPTRNSSINKSSPVIAATQTQMPMPMTSSSSSSSSPNTAPQVNSSLPNVAEVKIISQDFAGLGRVYEI